MVVLMRARRQGRRSPSNMSMLGTRRGADVMLSRAAFNNKTLTVGLTDR